MGLLNEVELLPMLSYEFYTMGSMFKSKSSRVSANGVRTQILLVLILYSSILIQGLWGPG
jgi:hypothetical protein